MKFSISSKLLLSHLSTVSKVVNTKNTISILDNFLFCLEGDKLIITGSDQETILTTTVEVAFAEGEGSFAVNVKSLLDLLKEIPDQPLEFSIDENYAIELKYLNGHFDFSGIDGNEFPQKESLGEVHIVCRRHRRNAPHHDGYLLGHKGGQHNIRRFRHSQARAL